MAFRARHMFDKFNETKQIYYCIYNAVTVMTVGVPLIAVLNNVPYALVTLEVVIIVLISTFTLVALFFHVWMKLLFGDEDEFISSLRKRNFPQNIMMSPKKSHKPKPMPDESSKGSVDRDADKAYSYELTSSGTTTPRPFAAANPPLPVYIPASGASFTLPTSFTSQTGTISATRETPGTFDDSFLSAPSFISHTESYSSVLNNLSSSGDTFLVPDSNAGALPSLATRAVVSLRNRSYGEVDSPLLQSPVAFPKINPDSLSPKISPDSLSPKNSPKPDRPEKKGPTSPEPPRRNTHSPSSRYVKSPEQRRQEGDEGQEAKSKNGEHVPTSPVQKRERENKENAETGPASPGPHSVASLPASPPSSPRMPPCL